MKSLIEFNVDIETARAILEVGGTIPRALCYFKLADVEAMCDEQLGDSTKSYKEQFYTSVIGEESFIVPGRSQIGISGTPTGNYVELEDEVFTRWVEVMGAENLYFPADLPTVEEKEVSPTFKVELIEKVVLDVRR
jgi:hypothetical protein